MTARSRHFIYADEFSVEEVDGKKRIYCNFGDNDPELPYFGYDMLCDACNGRIPCAPDDYPDAERTGARNAVNVKVKIADNQYFGDVEYLYHVGCLPKVFLPALKPREPKASK